MQRMNLLLPLPPLSLPAVNYVAVTEALQASPSVVASGLAADNLICALYFTSLFALAANIPADPPAPATGTGKGRGGVGGMEGSEGRDFSLLLLDSHPCCYRFTLSHVL